MISLKDYAQDNGISYEAVRSQVSRYRDELEGHIHKQGKKQFLDEVAVAFLDQHRAQNPVAIYNSDTTKELEELRRQKEELLERVAAQAEKMSEIAQWQADMAVKIAEVNQTKLLLEASKEETERLRSEATQAQQEASEAKIEIETLKADNKALRDRKWWQMIFSK